MLTAEERRTVAAWAEAFLAFVRYEKENGKAWTILRYNPLNHSLLTPLNYDIPSIYGDVDVDWMLRVAWAAQRNHEGHAFYYGAKFLWNVLDPRRGFDLRRPFHSLSDRLFHHRSILQEGNRNAPQVAHVWVTTDATLPQIFAPAMSLLDQSGWK